MIKSALAKGNPTLVVDAGNWGSGKGFSAWEKTAFIFNQMSDMRYDVVTPGDAELVQGADALRKLLSAHANLKAVSANIKDKSGRLVFPESVVINKSGLRFGVTATTGGSYYSFNVTKGLQAADDFSFDDSRAALSRVIPKLRGECDIVVVLMHEDPGDAKRLVQEVPGMDVVIVGHNPGYQPSPERVGQTLMVRPSNRGQYVCSLELALDGSGKIVDFSGEGTPLGETVAKDPEFDRVVTQWETDFKARQTAGSRQKAPPAGSPRDHR